MRDNDFGITLKTLGICSVNREEWLLTDLAANLLDVTSVPLYETLGEEMMTIILNQTEMTTLFGSDVCLTSTLKLLRGAPSYLRNVVSFDPEVSPNLREVAEECGVKIFDFHKLINDIEEKGYEPIDPSSNSLDTVFTISYTSGTSGNSKGVMLTNLNFLSAITNILQIADVVKINNSDVYISYLPLAHVFDRLGCHAVLSQGGQIGFFGGKILEITQDLMLLKPTIFASVPRLLNKVYDRVVAGVQDVSTFRKFLFYQALHTK